MLHRELNSSTALEIQHDGPPPALNNLVVEVGIEPTQPKREFYKLLSSPMLSSTVVGEKVPNRTTPRKKGFTDPVLEPLGLPSH